MAPATVAREPLALHPSPSPGSSPQASARSCGQASRAALLWGAWRSGPASPLVRRRRRGIRGDRFAGGHGAEPTMGPRTQVEGVFFRAKERAPGIGLALVVLVAVAIAAATAVVAGRPLRRRGERRRDEGR